MNEEIARKILQIAMNCSREIDQSVELTMGKCSEDEFRTYRRHAGMMMASIFHHLMVPIFTEFPHLAPDWYNTMDAAAAAKKSKD
jgi:hypothetical protein